MKFAISEHARIQIGVSATVLVTVYNEDPTAAIQWLRDRLSGTGIPPVSPVSPTPPAPIDQPPPSDGYPKAPTAGYLSPEARQRVIERRLAGTPADVIAMQPHGCIDGQLRQFTARQIRKVVKSAVARARRTSDPSESSDQSDQSDAPPEFFPDPLTREQRASLNRRAVPSDPSESSDQSDKSDPTPKAPQAPPSTPSGRANYLTRPARAMILAEIDRGVSPATLAQQLWPFQDGSKRHLTPDQIRKAATNQRQLLRTSTKSSPAPAVRVRRSKSGPLHDIPAPALQLPPLELGDNPAEFLTPMSIAAIRSLLKTGKTWDQIHSREWKFQDGKSRRISASRLRAKYEAQTSSL